MTAARPPDRSQVRSVLISNVYADDNRGGAALTRACIEAVEAAFPQMERLALVSIRPFADVRQQFRHTLTFRPECQILQPLLSPDREVRSLRLVIHALLCLFGRVTPGVNRETYERIASADVVVSRGGVIFWQRHRSLANALGLWLTTFPLRLALRRRIPVAVYGAHIGPLPSRISRLVAGSILRRAYVVIVRDSESEELALSLGCPRALLRRAPDSVMRLQKVPGPEDRPVAGEGTFAAVTVTGDLVAQSATQASSLLAEVIERLLQSGAVEEIVFVLQVDGVEDSDRPATVRFLEQLKSDRCGILEKDLSVEELLGFYGQARCVVGMRLHSTILGLVSGTIAFPLDLGHSHKVRSVYAEFGLSDLVLSLDGGTSASEVVLSTLQDPALYERVSDAVAAARRRLLEAESGMF